MPSLTDAGASKTAFPRGAWERVGSNREVIRGLILSYGNGGPPSDFNGVSVGYLGFDFNIGNGNEYGYVEIAGATGSDAAFSATMTIVGYAYDNSGASIVAAPLSVVPEPSSLVMCGLAGLIGGGYAWRRGRRPATA